MCQLLLAVSCVYLFWKPTKSRIWNVHNPHTFSTQWVCDWDLWHKCDCKKHKAIILSTEEHQMHEEITLFCRFFHEKFLQTQLYCHKDSVCKHIKNFAIDVHLQICCYFNSCELSVLKEIYRQPTTSYRLFAGHVHQLVKKYFSVIKIWNCLLCSIFTIVVTFS